MDIIELRKIEKQIIPVKFPATEKEPEGFLGEVTIKFATLDSEDEVHKIREELSKKRISGKISNSDYQIEYARTVIDFDKEVEKRFRALELPEFEYFFDRIKETILKIKEDRKKN